ncbi:MAG: hypothetical protein IPL97_01695 [Niastella sp.]|nr:hypothetical protein [Niastella sp.]
MKLVLFLMLNIFITPLYCQQKLVVHFLYGSVPAKGYEKTEKKLFGGLKGGHVSIQLGDSIIGFQPKGRCHIIANNEDPNGYFKVENLLHWSNDTVGKKYTSVEIPVSSIEYKEVSNLLNGYLQQAPYDYAVFGMRCAAATYDALEDIGIVKPLKQTGKWLTYFYPQLFRRHLLKIASENNYTVLRKKGTVSRKWEME